VSGYAASAVTRRQPSGRKTAGNQETPRKRKEKRNVEHFAGRLALDTFLLNSLKADWPRNENSSFSPSLVVSVNETAKRRWRRRTLQCRRTNGRPLYVHPRRKHTCCLRFNGQDEAPTFSWCRLK